ncbi:GNAT family N-acetyltransferase [Chitinivibrio alkaliphilus]|uniref:N-Acyltransferase n=1 Tax=Chitinivibrio alkaliphilus ACht1 TaxID=1313304 RepID=U7D6Y2_9BACT|nr:GNAT family N-acetyltransferase [Chitinivibrio alkaliphilus]ERP30822.1 N-Acyltransferase [Chitinivibrio alkaliphilus ACht1]
MNLRKATCKDAPMLYCWFCDEGTRRYSISSNTPSWDDHCAWLKEKLAARTCQIYIGTDEEREIGVLRFEAVGTEHTISITIAPSCRGRGYGTALLSMGIHHPSCPHPLTAYILPVNHSSRRLFEKTGFLLQGSHLFSGKEFLRYEYP